MQWNENENEIEQDKGLCSAVHKCRSCVATHTGVTYWTQSTLTTMYNEHGADTLQETKRCSSVANSAIRICAPNSNRSNRTIEQRRAYCLKLGACGVAAIESSTARSFSCRQALSATSASIVHGGHSVHQHTLCFRATSMVWCGVVRRAKLPRIPSQ